MSRATVLARGRRAAEASMVDTCTIRRIVSQATNQDTGAVTPTYLTPDPYNGRCRIQQPQAQARPHDVGEDFVLIARLEVQLPVAVAGLQVADEITVTASTRDPDLVGRVFLIHDLPRKTEATARRVQVTERTAS